MTSIRVDAELSYAKEEMSRPFRCPILTVSRLEIFNLLSTNKNANSKLFYYTFDSCHYGWSENEPNWSIKL